MSTGDERPLPDRQEEPPVRRSVQKSASDFYAASAADNKLGLIYSSAGAVFLLGGDDLIAVLTIYNNASVITRPVLEASASSGVNIMDARLPSADVSQG